MHDIMIDLETLGTDQDSIFITIGAVVFDVSTGEMGEKLSVNIDWQTCIDAGRTFSADTIKWWLKQSDNARAGIMQTNVSRLLEALIKLQNFICNVDGAIVWGNGATFDISILEHAYKNSKLSEAPWKYYNVNDCRTVVRLAKQIGVYKKDFPFLGIEHNALDDAIYQAGYISAMWQALTKQRIA